MEATAQGLPPVCFFCGIKLTAHKPNQGMVCEPCRERIYAIEDQAERERRGEGVR